MKILKQLAIITTFTIIGEFMSKYLPIKIPGSVIGLLLLFFALEKNIIKLENIKETGNWLKNNMAFLFVPLTVGLMTSWEILQENLLVLTVIMVVTTALTMISVAVISEKLEDR